MGKLKLQAQVSIDGFIAGPSGEMDWHAVLPCFGLTAGDDDVLMGGHTTPVIP